MVPAVVMEAPAEQASDGPDTDSPTPTQEYLSYSRFSQLSDCGKQYQLRRVLKLPENPSVWFIAGHAVHSATEDIDRVFAEHGR